VLIRQLAFAAADGERSEHERDQALTQLTAVADRSLRLTTDLTRAARLEDSLFEVEPVNAQQLCEMIVAQIAPLYAEYGRTIYTTSHRSRPLVLAHRELLSSVLYHFADNALHYGHADSSVTMSIQARQSKGVLRIGVRDAGPAMSVREWRELQRQPQGSLVTRPQGSGLGLYIAGRFAAAMNGTIGLTRHRDGVTFYVDLPVSEQLSLL
jgi:signal transduction histidine kinase